MDSEHDLTAGDAISDIPIPIPRQTIASRWSGWLIGAVLGVLASLWAFPAVRYTLTAQIEFALAEDSVPWLSSLDAERTAREGPRLDLVAARYPEDYLIQVGRATALATQGGLRAASPPHSHGDDSDMNDHTLVRLGAVTRSFSTLPGAYAHLARYLMADRVRIQRSELYSQKPNAPPDPTIPSTTLPGARSVRVMLWALESGERLDPDNGFWPAMLATTYFADAQDDKALVALARAAHKPRWDAYIYEEVLGQWRLYSAAYGDHGATQKIGPLSLVVFPHLHEIRRMAELARWHAELFASRHQEAEAAKIRRNLAHLGTNLRDNAGWAFEALYGTDLFFIACTDIDSKLAPGRIRTAMEWEPQAVRYHSLLAGLQREYEYRLVRSEVDASCELRKRVDLARYDASYPGMPPGIPLMPLFGNWMGGICLVQQSIGLLAAIGISMLWQRAAARSWKGMHRHMASAIVFLILVTATSSLLLLFLMTTPRMAGLSLAGLALLTIASLERIWMWRVRRAGREEAVSVPVGSAAPGRAPLPSFSEGMAIARSRWTHGTTVRVILLVVLPYLALLYTNRAELSVLHPVAILLTSLTGSPRASGLADAAALALLASALPLLLPVLCAAWGLYRGAPPLAAVFVGLRRLALPCLFCLIAAYGILLNRTLILDADASQAIQKAALNDRQWVLTHGADSPF